MLVDLSTLVIFGMQVYSLGGNGVTPVSV